MANLAPLFDLSLLDGLIEQPENTTVIAANRRLAAKINQAYQQRSAISACPTIPPSVLSLSDFLSNRYYLLLAQGRLPFKKVLKKSVDRYLWREVIRSQLADDAALLNVSSTVPLATNAFELALNYGLSGSDFNPHFAAWYAEYQHVCEDLNAMCIAQMEHDVIKLHGPQLESEQFLFIGFETLSPLYQELFDCLQAKHVGLPRKVNEQSLLWFADAESELIAAIDKAIDYTRANPGRRFGIVDSRLSQRRSIVERILRERIEGQLPSVCSDRTPPPVNISAGQSGLDVPLLSIVLDLLQTWREQLDIETLFTLTHTPFIGDADEELFKRGSWYQQVVKLGRPDNAQAFLREYGVDQCPTLINMWQLAAEQSRRSDLQRAVLSVEEWCDQLQQLLAIWQWPGQRETDSLEFQQLTLWLELMEDMRHFPTHIKVNLQDFAVLLREQLSMANFQSQVEDSAIQILGSLEAACLSFDCLWVLGASDEAFPAKASPSPLLSLQTQRALNMPHCDALRELRFFEGLLASYRASAEKIVFSYARFEGDIEKRLSPLLNDVSEQEGVVTVTSLSPADVVWFEDELAKPVLDPTQIKGGAAVLADQANCPFSAFAKHRLGLKKTDQVSHAMPAHIKGSAVHRALEVLLPANLHQQDIDAHVSQSLDQAIDQAIEVMARQRPDIMHARFKAMEKQRLRALLLEWVEIEKQRPPFRVVATEQPAKANFAGLPLSLRVDRIDQLDSHRVMVIDYKTGAASTSQWLDERPDDPQLLLYALLNDNGDVDAIAKASLKPGELAYKGLSANETHIVGIKPLVKSDEVDPDEHWHQQKIRWHERLDGLANEFISGDAQVLPKNKSSCQYCHLQDVCRIGERR